MRKSGKILETAICRKTGLAVLLGVFCLLGSFIPGYSQIKDVRIKVGGLTCSQCSRSVEMELRKLSFVRDVDMDLENTQTLVYFKTGATVDWPKLAKAASNAGFKTLSVQVDLETTPAQISDNGFTFQGKEFRFIDASAPVPAGTGRFQIIAPGFVSGKELKSYEALAKTPINVHTYLLKQVND